MIMTKKETAQILAIVRSVYPNTKIEDPSSMVEGWYLVLGEYPAETIMMAARLHMASSKYFPTPSEITDKIVRAEIMYGIKPLVQNIIDAQQVKQIEDHCSNDDGFDDILQIME